MRMNRFTEVHPLAYMFPIPTIDEGYYTLLSHHEPYLPPPTLLVSLLCYDWWKLRDGRGGAQYVRACNLKHAYWAQSNLGHTFDEFLIDGTMDIKELV